MDLYVRESNKVAIQMYTKLGYVVYRRVLGYYSEDAVTPEEDALGRGIPLDHDSNDVAHVYLRMIDMRKALSRDPERRSMIPCKKPVRAEDVS